MNVDIGSQVTLLAEKMALEKEVAMQGLAQDLEKWSHTLNCAMSSAFPECLPHSVYKLYASKVDLEKALAEDVGARPAAAEAALFDHFGARVEYDDETNEYALDLLDVRPSPLLTSSSSHSTASRRRQL